MGHTHTHKSKLDLLALPSVPLPPVSSNGEEGKGDAPPAKPKAPAEKRKADSTEPLAGEPVKQKAHRDGGLLGLTSYLADRKGEREEMQDSHLQLDDYSKLLDNLHPSM